MMIAAVLGLMPGIAGRAVAAVLPLAGEWRFAMGGPAPGTKQQALPELRFADTINLPGTTETNRKGRENPDRWAGGLTRLYPFNGPAWYDREVTIPETWRNQRATLFLERTKYSQVWLDGKPCGDSMILCTPQEYALGQLTPGAHRLTIVVDNTRKPFNVEAHQWSDNTQGNWNGIIGRIELQARPSVSLDDVQVYPDVTNKSAVIQVRVSSASGQAGQGKLTGSIKGPGVSIDLPSVNVAWENEGGFTTVQAPLGRGAQLWDEFHPNLYRLVIWLAAAEASDERTVTFGLREITHPKTQFAINGRTTFLRGKHDGCVFPLTGHSPMDAAGWRKYFAVCQEYGINHVRFHTWTPPEAAFEAADQLGLYLQPELPYWGGYEAAQRDGLMPEAECILKTYGNHPSFVMMALGNECSGSRAVMGDMVRQLRQRDRRHLYTQGSNNYFWDPSLAEGDDYWTTVRTHTARGGPMHNVRGSYATVDGGNGHIQVGPPGTWHDYSTGIAGLPIPVIGHEIGQFTVYPHFREIVKYTGVFRARNFEHWRDKLAAAGMLDQADELFRASGKLAALCYRADIEAALRTHRFGGFQLLDLQDFPGQGTALVGMLDAFMESKGLITAQEWRQFCSPIVLLARFPKYTWTVDETFSANIELAHYGEKDLANVSVAWAIQDRRGRKAAAGKLRVGRVEQGGLRQLGVITAPLADLRKPTRLDLTLALEGEPVATCYPMWVYPSREVVKNASGVHLARKLGSAEMALLAQGSRVVFIPEAKSKILRSVGGGFATDFWCWPMFKNKPGTMGILCDPNHPALAGFPTEFHSDWQWFHILTNSRPVILDGLAKEIRPIVQVVDNLDRVHKLGLIFEAKVGPGRLLVCASDLASLNDAAASHLLGTLYDYAGSARFNPQVELAPEAARELLAAPEPLKGKATASSSQSATYGPEKALDGDESTRWCAATNTADQWWQVDLDQPCDLTGCTLDWEFDHAGYCYILEGSTDGTAWATLSDQRKNSFSGHHQLAFTAKGVRHVRLRVTGLPDGDWASLREVRLVTSQ
jgi:hypothetical protein